MGSFPPVSPPRTYTPLSSSILATCRAHLILLDFITRTILGEVYRIIIIIIIIIINDNKRLPEAGPLVSKHVEDILKIKTLV